MDGEVLLRGLVFVAVLAGMAALEALWPRRVRRWPRGERWTTNLAIVLIDGVVVRIMAALAVPVAAIAAAAFAEANGLGLLRWLGVPWGASLAVSLVVLDFAIWLQHVASHRVPMLWRIHRMHHADTDFDVTTALRFHPIEIALSMLWKVAWVLALGVPVLAVLVFEVVLNACAMFNHANLALPARLDRVLRLVVVTPDMHRVHHSIDSREHHANFGFNLALWDRLLGTYVAQPAKGHDGMTIGLAPWQSEAPSRLGWCLGLPFRAAEGRPADGDAARPQAEVAEPARREDRGSTGITG